MCSRAQLFKKKESGTPELVIKNQRNTMRAIIFSGQRVNFFMWRSLPLIHFLLEVVALLNKIIIYILDKQSNALDVFEVFASLPKHE